VTRRRLDILPEFRVRRLPEKGTVRFPLKRPPHAPEATAADREAKFQQNPDHVAAAIAADELERVRTKEGRKLTRSESTDIITAAIEIVTEWMPHRHRADVGKVRERIRLRRAGWPSEK
jgi:hypothetical protein